jgi:amino-acid N-acetyltransferase
MGDREQDVLRKAKIADACAIKSLIEVWAGKGLMLHKSLSEIYDNLRDFWVIEKSGGISACAALHISWEDLAEVRSMAVSEGGQRQGAGSRLLSACMSEAIELGVRKVFALTYATGFFLKHGFREIDKSTLPHKIWSECIKCPKFPNCDETAVLYEFDRRENGVKIE